MGLYDCGYQLKIEGDSKRDLQHKLEAERKKRKDLTKQKSEWKHSRETDVETVRLL
jgi:hypothetical protein